MIASLIPIFLLIDGPKTGLKLLHGQVEASLLCLLCSSKRKEKTIHLIMYGGRHLINMEERIFWRGNPLFARESKGNPPTGLISNIVDHLHVIPGGTSGNSCWGCATRNPFSDQKRSFQFHTLFRTWPLKSTPVFRPGL